MDASSIPAKFPIPFADGAGPSFIRVIPVPSQQAITPGAASFTDGFPPLTAQQLGAGGIPPDIKDFNGILFDLSSWDMWQQAGGPVGYDGTFSGQIGGYPQGALLFAASGLGWWLSLVDNNVTNPDTGGAGWQLISLVQVYAGNPNGHLAGTAATSTSAPAAAWDSTDGVLWICTNSGSSSTAAWSPLPILIPVNAIGGAVRSYGTTDLGRLRVRSNAGTAMTDFGPAAGAVANGWWTQIFNADASALLVFAAFAGTSLNSIPGGTLTLAPGQTATIAADQSGNLWTTVAPVPRFASSQAIYVDATGAYGPGVYDVDTTAGPITMALTASPALGDNYEIRDVGGVLATNNLILDPSMNTIAGLAGAFACDVNAVRFGLSFKFSDWSLQ